MARLGVRASVQPAHLLDDRDTTYRLWADRAARRFAPRATAHAGVTLPPRLWADRADRCFALRSMADAGVTLALGSDAPVAALDPWLAMAAAVHRSAAERAQGKP